MIVSQWRCSKFGWIHRLTSDIVLVKGWGLPVYQVLEAFTQILIKTCHHLLIFMPFQNWHTLLVTMQNIVITGCQALNMNNNNNNKKAS